MNLRASVVSVVDALTQDVRQRILSGELPQGTALGEVDLAGRYDVSRPTARSALDALVAARLMVRGAHKTARVVSLTPADVDDIYDTRLLIEIGAVRQLAARLDAPSAAYAANTEITTISEGSPRDIILPDIKFHRSLVDALQSERTSLAYALLADEVELCMTQVQDAHLLNTAAIVGEHAGILAAIEAGNATLAESMLEDHLDRARARLHAYLDTQDA